MIIYLSVLCIAIIYDSRKEVISFRIPPKIQARIINTIIYPFTQSQAINTPNKASAASFCHHGAFTNQSLSGLGSLPPLPEEAKRPFVLRG